MKKLICFSLWGEEDKYNVGAIKNADLAADIYPDWVCRFYIGRTAQKYAIQELSNRPNTEVFLMNDRGDWTSMFWRFYPASEPAIHCMISRDTDSRLTWREKLAVDQWLASGKGFHIMRDHPYHATEILGGMWGATSGTLPSMQSEIEKYVKGDFWQVDQNFLKERIYPLIKDNVCVHDPFFEKVPFPQKREHSRFVGQAFNGDDSMCEPSHGEMVNLPPPPPAKKKRKSKRKKK